MSNAWGPGGYQQQPYTPPQSSPGGVKLFDPTQFNSPQLQNPTQFDEPTASNAGQHVNAQQPAALSTSGSHPQEAWNNYAGWHSQDGSSVDGSQQQINGQGQYSTAWNPSWDGAGVYAQPNQHIEAPTAYPQNNQQTEAPSSYAQPHGNSAVQFFDGFGQQQYSQHSPPQGYDASFNHQQPSTPQQHQSTPPTDPQLHNQPSYADPTFDQQPPQQEQPQHQMTPPRELQPQQNYQPQAEQSGDQAQAYGQDPHVYFDQGQEQYQSQGHYQSPGQEQYQGQGHAFYDQPFDANSWAPSQATGEWEQGFHPQTAADNNPAPVIQPPTESGHSLEHTSHLGHQAPSQQTANDGDGTVSGFFGRGDDDGDVQSDSHKTIRQDPGSARPVHQIPADGEFNRGETNEASLDLSREDEEGRAPLNDLQNLVHHMENVHLSQQDQADVGHSQGAVANPPHHHETNSATDNQDVHLQQAGTYSDFSAHQHLPVDTSGRSSPTDRDQPDSTESGGSGASVGADWEMVPSAMTNSRNSLDNVGFFPDKPDGGVSVDRLRDGDSSLRQSDQGAAVPPASIPPPHHIGSEASREPLPNLSSNSVDRQNPSVGERHHVPQSLPPVSAPAPVLPPTYGALPPQGDSPGNPFRKSGVSPRHNAIQPPVHSSPNQYAPVSSTPSTTFSPPTSAFNSVLKDPDHQRSKGAAFSPSKPKIPTSTEDGSGPSKRDSDSDATRSQTHGSSRNRPENVSPRQRSSNSRDSDEATEQRRHHSAFQPVNRARAAAPSPAATLWDNPAEPAPATNILLAPAVPLIIPAMNTYNTAKERDSSGAKTDQAEKPTKEPERKAEPRRDKEDVNRSFDSLDEIDRDYSRDPRDRSYRGDQRHDPRNDTKDPRYPRDSYRGDRSYSRAQYQYDRPISRAERPLSRSGEYMRDDAYRKHRGYYRDYDRDSFYEDRYERPRSRQDETRNSSRPSSRGPEAERPRSRGDHDSRDRDYYRDRHTQRGYGYEGQGPNRQDYLNEERERYLRYYKEKEARYNRGYYEEYYGNRHAADYQQQQRQHTYHQQSYQQQLHPTRTGGRHSSLSVEDPHSRSQSRNQSRNQSRGNTPSHSRNASRGNTPSLEPPNGGKSRKSRRELFRFADYYGRDSRAPSRMDYSAARQGYTAGNQDYTDYYARQGYSYDPYGYQDGYGYDPYNYGYGYQQGYDATNQSQAAYDAGRLTPPKYSYPHVRACFGPGGQLVKVLANRPADGQPAVVEIQDVQTVLESCLEAETLRSFPGPLTRASSHKKDVLMFCGGRARSCLDNIDMLDRESAGLIWRLLELLIKQNGSVVGTDLSDLLLEGHDPALQPYAVHSARASQSPEMDADSRNSPAIRVTTDRTMITAVEQREESTDRFRLLLTYGRKKDALECAMKNNLWGHALFLASKMDTRTHASVMTRFANSAMRMNDPLQTLYQLMSGRQPAAVTGIVDERWGDWRPHLAMILSNQTSRHELDRKSICTLGDTLATKGCLHASHFCYLMAHVNFGSFFKKTSKIVLIGANHNLPMEEFASDEAIQCTEVYEYAQALGSPAFCLPHFQIYKYLYACKLADYGMASEALLYCEVIAATIQQHPTSFQPSFVKLVYQLSSKLKFSDPQRLQTSEDAEDPEWMQQLLTVSAAFDEGSIQPISGTATPALYGGTTTSSESGDHYTYSGDQTQSLPNDVSSYSHTGFDQSSLDSGLYIQQYGQHQQHIPDPQQQPYDPQQPPYDTQQPSYDPQQQQTYDAQQQQPPQQQYEQQLDPHQQQSYDQQQQQYNQQQQQQYDQQQPYDPNQYQSYGHQQPEQTDSGSVQHSHIETPHQQPHHEPQQHQQQHESQQQQQQHLQQQHQEHQQQHHHHQHQYLGSAQHYGNVGHGFGQTGETGADWSAQGQPDGQVTQRSSLSTTEEEDEAEEAGGQGTGTGFDYFGQMGNQVGVCQV